MDGRELVQRIGRVRSLDVVAEPLVAATERTLPPGPVRDGLKGTWLGHPLHPLLTDIPIGCFSSATILDFVGGRRGRAAADRLLALGLLSAIPTAAAGAVDWSETEGEARRIGVAHATTNAIGLVFYAKSYISRKRGRRARGVLQALVGMTAMSAGGYLGGHLTFVKGVGVEGTHQDNGRSEYDARLVGTSVPVLEEGADRN
jgi:uncharacterized membrane protein